MKVYLTNERSMPGLITGIYLDKDLAEKEAKERGDADTIDEFDVIDANKTKINTVIFASQYNMDRHISLKEVVCSVNKFINDNNILKSDIIEYHTEEIRRNIMPIDPTDIYYCYKITLSYFGKEENSNV